MKDKKDRIYPNGAEDTTALTIEDLNEFMAATSYEEQWKMLLAHAEINNKIVKIRRRKTMEQLNDYRYEEIREQFEEFCRTKGIAAKFRVAFSDMAENAHRQHEADKANLEEVKRQSAQANPEFTEFLHTKGFKAKVRLVIENIKKGAKDAPQRTAVAVDGVSAQTRANIAKAQADIRGTTSYGAKTKDVSEYSADALSREFNEFLKAKGLDTKYAVEICDADAE